MAKPKIAVIVGSIREGRNADKVLNWFKGAVKDNQNAELEYLDLRDYPMPLYADSDKVRYREGKHPNPDVQKWLDKIGAADGFVIITTEYNRGYPASLKNAIDYGSKEWFEKPLGFVAYGGFAGGARAVEQLRQVAGELRMYDVRDMVIIPHVWAAFDEQGNLPNSEANVKNANLMLDKVAELAVKLK